ncbi:hypothetical protein COB55_05570 [Candidatus Wolfebacteria bacterium]|nr:MAG: hypothetical protein COB55_05570 [Candidatus Wolfebacteria bacterium]
MKFKLNKKNTLFLPKSHISDDLISKESFKYLKSLRKVIKDKKLENKPCEEIVGVLFDYKIKYITGDSCGGYCDIENKTIALNIEHYDIDDKQRFLHELGHTIQNEIGLFDIKENKLLSHKVKIEQETESMSYYLFDMIYTKDIDKKHNLLFDSYFSIEDFVWLKNWYRHYNIENDLIIKIND